jgi:hypothetical protein
MHHGMFRREQMGYFYRIKEYTVRLGFSAESMVPEEGLEPSHPEGYQILSLARLPVPPLRRLLALKRVFLTFSSGMPCFQGLVLICVAKSIRLHGLCHAGKYSSPGLGIRRDAETKKDMFNQNSGLARLNRLSVGCFSLTGSDSPPTIEKGD